MKDSTEDKKKRTPKRKEKRRRASAAISIAASEQNYDSPYQDTAYKVPNSEKKRSSSKINLQTPSSIIKENGAFVDTLFPSEHLVAMSIAENEAQNEADNLESVGEDPPLDITTPNEVPMSYDPADRNQVLVKDPDSKETVTTKCIAGREDSVFVGPSGAEPKPTDPYVLSRCLIQKRFGSGVLLLRPMEMKPTQLVTRGDLIFQLWYGRVSLTIHESTSVIVSGDFFFVPRGNTYSIKNLRNEEAKFSYTVVKEVPPEKEASDKEIMERKERESKMGQVTAREGTFVTDTPRQKDESLLRPTVGDAPKDNVVENTPRPKDLEPNQKNVREQTTYDADHKEEDKPAEKPAEPLLTPQHSLEPTDWKPVVV